MLWSVLLQWAFWRYICYLQSHSYFILCSHQVQCMKVVSYGKNRPNVCQVLSWVWALEHLLSILKKDLFFLCIPSWPWIQRPICLCLSSDKRHAVPQLELGCLWIFSLLLGPFYSYWVASSRLYMRVGV